MAEIRYNPASSDWEIWDTNTQAFIAPTSSSNLGGEDTVTLDQNTPDGLALDALGGSDAYYITSDFDSTITISDPQTSSGTTNTLTFHADVLAESVSLQSMGLGAQKLVITLSSGATITVTGVGSFTFALEGETTTPLSAADFAAEYPDGWIIDPANAVFNPSVASLVLNTSNADANTAFSFATAITATDENDNPISFSLIDAPFAGLSIDATSGIISYAAGTPPPAGTYTVAIGATSIGITGSPVTVTEAIQIVVQDAARDAAFDAGLPSQFAFQEGEDGSVAAIVVGTPITATDPNGDAVTYSINQAATDAGFAIRDTGQLIYSGTGDAIGITQITVTASSLGASGSAQAITTVISLTVTAAEIVEDVAGTTGGDNLGDTASTESQKIDGGDGNDVIADGAGDDEISGDEGNDNIDLATGGADEVRYVASLSGGGMDGGDTIENFVISTDGSDANGDVLSLRFEQTGAIDTLYSTFESLIDGADGTEHSHDDLLCVKIIIEENTPGVYTIPGVTFAFRSAGVYAAGQKLASGELTVMFETAFSDVDFITAVGGMDNINSDILVLTADGVAALFGNSFDYQVARDVEFTLTRDTVADAVANNERLDYWDLSGMTSSEGNLFRDLSSHTLFNGVDPQFNQDISGWDVSGFSSLLNWFKLAPVFNQDLGSWDVSSVTNARGAFYGATAFEGDGLENWQTGNFETTQEMFKDATSFNALLSDWDMSSVHTMHNMFHGATSFDGTGIGAWDVSNVINANMLFADANAFNEDIGDWDVSSFAKFDGAFKRAISFNQDLSDWDVSGATDFIAMFEGADSFNQDISAWDVSGADALREMFRYNDAFNQDLSAWDVSANRHFQHMFSETVVFDQNLGGWDISNARYMHGMFDDAAAMSQENMDLTLRGWARIESDEQLYSDVLLGFANVDYTDATALAKITDNYNWVVTPGNLLSSATIGAVTYGVEVLTSGADTQSYASETGGVMVHGLDGDDTITGSAFADRIQGGGGDDTLTGGTGADIFQMHFEDSGSDTITDFNVAEDKINISGLLEDFISGQADISDYLTLTEQGSDLQMVFDLDGAGSGTTTTSITLQNVSLMDIGSDYEMIENALLIVDPHVF